MKKMSMVFLFVVIAGLAFGQNGGLITDYTGANETPLVVTKGDHVLRDTVYAQYIGEEKDVVIPENYGITKIGENSFARSTITSVVIPPGVQEIGAFAFYESYSITNVSIPNGVKVISQYAFNDTSLENLTLPDSVLVIEAGAFGSHLKKITLPANVTFVGEDRWYGDTFGSAYNSGGKKAGTYHRGFGGWYMGASPSSIDIAPNTTRKATLREGQRHLYRIVIPSDNQSLTASLENDEYGTDLCIYDTAGEQIRGVYLSYWKTPKMNIPTSAGTYYIGIGGQGTYSLKVSIEKIQFTDLTPGEANVATLQANVPQYFKVTIPTGNVTLSASTENNPNTRLRLYNSAWKQIAPSSLSATKKVTANVPAGDYYFKVEGANASSEGPYSLFVSTTDKQVTSIKPGTAHNATLRAGSFQDFKVTVPIGNMILSASTENNPSTRLRILDSALQQIAPFSSAAEKVTANVPGGDYFIRVEGATASSAGSYTLNVSTEKIQVSDIIPGTAHDATLQPRIPQYYQFTVPSNAMLSANTNNRYARLRVYDTTWKQIAPSTSSATEKVETIPVAAGKFYIKIEGINASSEGAYSLNVSTESMEIKDMKPDTSRLETYQIGSPQFYRMVVSNNMEFSGYLESNHDVRWQVFDATWMRIADPGKDKKLNTILATGTYYVKIDSNSGTVGESYPYYLNFSTQPLQIVDIVPKPAHNAMLQAGIPQYYRVTIPPGEATLSVTVENNNNTLMWIYNSAWEEISIPGEQTKVSEGFCFVKIEGLYDSSEGPYALYVTTEPAQ